MDFYPVISNLPVDEAYNAGRQDRDACCMLLTSHPQALNLWSRMCILSSAVFNGIDENCKYQPGSQQPRAGSWV